MGACYTVVLKVSLTNETGAIKALNDHIAKDTGVRYALEKYANVGVTPDTFDGLMKILLAELQHKISISQEGEFRTYENDFDASYGWEDVMIQWFEVLSPFLADGSQLLIYPDDGYNELKIIDGKCVRCEDIIYTHDEAGGIIEMFELILDRNGIKIPSPEDDERGEDNCAALYGSVYGKLLDDIDEALVDILDRAKNGADVVSYEFSGSW